MADISAQELKDAIKDILKGTDHSTVTAKSVRTKLEAKLDADLSSRRKEIDAIIMAEFEDQVSSEEVSEDEAPKARKGKAAKNSDSDDAPEEKDDDYEPGSAKKAVKAAKKPSKSKAKKRKNDDSDDDDRDEDWGKKKKPKKAPGTGPKKQSAFTRSYKLSPELADVVGAEVMPRHEVVKKLWAVIKERELQDPKNKQFAICDDQLLKVFGIKRFRTFGMMKFLKDHFVEAV